MNYGVVCGNFNCSVSGSVTGIFCDISYGFVCGVICELNIP
jgi:hypothetical protein